LDFDFTQALTDPECMRMFRLVRKTVPMSISYNISHVNTNIPKER